MPLGRPVCMRAWGSPGCDLRGVGGAGGVRGRRGPGRRLDPCAAVASCRAASPSRARRAIVRLRRAIRGPALGGGYAARPVRVSWSGSSVVVVSRGRSSAGRCWPPIDWSGLAGRRRQMPATELRGGVLSHSSPSARRPSSTSTVHRLGVPVGGTDLAMEIPTEAEVASIAIPQEGLRVELSASGRSVVHASLCACGCAPETSVAGSVTTTVLEAPRRLVEFASTG